jgi:hypothetical protein
VGSRARHSRLAVRNLRTAGARSFAGDCVEVLRCVIWFLSLFVTALTTGLLMISLTEVLQQLQIGMTGEDCSRTSGRELRS